MNMSMREKFLKQYQSVNIDSSVSEATPHKLVSMLYEGALTKLARAKGFMQQKQFKAKAEEIGKVSAILLSLRSNLDFESGKEVALNLDALYEYINRIVLEASRENSLEKLDEAMELIRTIKEGWDQMPDNIKQAKRSQIEKIKQMKN